MHIRSFQYLSAPLSVPRPTKSTKYPNVNSAPCPPNFQHLKNRVLRAKEANEETTFKFEINKQTIVQDHHRLNYPSVLNVAVDESRISTRPLDLRHCRCSLFVKPSPLAPQNEQYTLPFPMSPGVSGRDDPLGGGRFGDVTVELWKRIGVKAREERERGRRRIGGRRRVAGIGIVGVVGGGGELVGRGCRVMLGMVTG